jgi:hypothetical protein
MPRILYGIDIWATPTGRISEEGQAKGNRQIALKLNSVQRPGALAIVGGLRTSPSDSLCAHANITPIHLEIDKQCGRAALRLATLHDKHPLTKIAKKCAKGKVKRHRSPLHHLANVYKADPNTFETISSAGRNPAHIGKQPFKTDIPPSKEASKGSRRLSYAAHQSLH